MTKVFNLATTPLKPGVTLLEASAGTGKTFSLTGLILRLVLEEQIPINQILAVTYTIAATAELKERVRRKLAEALEQLRRCESKDETVNRILGSGDPRRSIGHLDLALQGFDEAQVFTIHGFCHRMLLDYAFESGSAFDSELVTDSTPLFEEVARDFWRIRLHETSPLVAALIMAWDKSPNDFISLLERTRNHPDAVFIPPAPGKSLARLVADLEQDMEKISDEWNSERAVITKILQSDTNLSRGTDKFPLERVQPLLGQINEACGDLDSINPGCLQALRDLSAEKIAAGTKLKGTPPAHPFFDLCSALSSDFEQLFRQWIQDFLEFARDQLQRRKARTNTVTFDDLILRLRNALRSSNGQRLAKTVGAKYRAVLVDEFQDTDPAQYEIFQRVFGRSTHHVYYIGDPKQAIYGFRGADVFTYIEAAAEASRTFTLGTNWRSEKDLVNAVNQLFGRAQDPFVLPQIQYHQIRAAADPDLDVVSDMPKAAGAPLAFRLVESTRDDGTPMNKDRASDAVCEAVASDMIYFQASGAKLGKRPIGFGDMAVLVRTNRQADQVQSVLRARGIRSILQSERSVFESTEAEDLQWLLQGIIEPGRDRLFKGALITSLIGRNADDLIGLETDEAKHQQWLDKFSKWRERWMSDCFIAAFSQVMVEQDIRARIVQLPGGERRLTNVLHLAELLHEAETTQRLRPDGLLAWLQKQRKATRISRDEFQLRLEGDTDAVQIVTIHKAKGLQYPIVFCPFLWTPAERSRRDEIQFHDRKNGDLLTISLVGEDSATAEQKAWQSEEIISEEIRMLYVAVTRAKNCCTIHIPEFQKISESPLARLFPEGARNDLPRALTALATASNGAIAVSTVPKEPATVTSPTTRSLAFCARPFNSSIDRTAMVASFSGINTGRIDIEEREPEVSDQPEAVAEQPVTSGNSIFDFERGTRAGDFFHAVLEQLDFANPECDSIVDEQLLWHGFGKSRCRDAIIATMHNLVEVEIDPGVSLKSIGLAARVSELEFTYRLNGLDPRRLREIFDRCEGLPAGFSENLGRLRFDPVEGYLKGFIDLLFESGGRYYVVDWKSNWLGNRVDDYNEAGMREAMLEHNYFLQAHLYALAADLFLQTRLKTYDFSRDFGGVFYLFLRGIDRRNPDFGIFRQRLSEQTITALRELAA